MYNNKYDTPITSLVVVPEEETLTGTISSDITTVVGTGTDFQGEGVREGDFIWDPSQPEIRKITGVSYDSQVLNIDSPFTVDLSGAPLLVVKKAQLKRLSIKNDGGAPALVDGNLFTDSSFATFDTDSANNGADQHIDPVVIDGSGTSISILKIQ